MSDITTSLDIQQGEGSVLDIAAVFPISHTRTLDLARHGVFIDTILQNEEPENTIDLSEDAIIRIDRFRTIELLDIALPEVIKPASWQKRFYKTLDRLRSIDLVPPLTIPYGSIDIRRDGVLRKTTTYPDLFSRSLPYGLLFRRFSKACRHTLFRHKKQISLSILGFFVISVPVLSYVAYALNHGYTTLESISATRDPSTVRTMIRSARGDFERASFLFAPFSWIPIDRVDTVDRITAGGLALTRGLDTILQALPATMEGSGITIKKQIEDPLSYRAAARDIFPMETLGISNPTDWIEEHREQLVQAQAELSRGGELYSGIRVTGERTERIQTIGTLVSRLATILDWSLKNQDDILNMLGHTNPERYIVFNQNRDEIRANGGFPGSILSFTLYKGNILDYHGDDVYYYDWNLYPHKEIPPPGIVLLTDTYGLRDVNYYPDFHETLDKANRFIERSGDATVTTGIAIHQGIIEDILAKVGPVTVSGVTLPFDEKNFSLLMSTLVEGKYGKENTPKDILFRFAEAFATKVIKKNAPLEIFDTLDSYLKKGEILFASRDTRIDSFLSKYRKRLPWECSDATPSDSMVTGSGVSIDHCSKNWIYPVWTSVSGNKSDRYITRKYEAKTKKIDACTYENSITLQTTHTMKASDQQDLLSYFELFGITDPVEKEKLNFIQGNGKNRAFVRIFVPLGSTLIGSGSDITTTSNDHATVFSILMETPVGASTSKSWKYTLDIPNCVSYDNQIEWTKQPGLREVLVR